MILKIISSSYWGLRAVEIPVPFHARVGEVKLNTWEDGIWNLWFLVTKMRDF
jgi:hypothetical protein